MRRKSSHIDQDDIATQAAQWFARCTSPDATPADRDAMERWLRADAAHQASYDELKALWADLGPASRAIGRRRRTRRVAIGGAALSAVALLTSSPFRRSVVDGLRADHRTTVGEIRRVMLDDGSELLLNTDTAVSLGFSGTERRVALLRGEAFFKVMTDPGRPFVVSDGAIEATALGTQFSVACATQDDGPTVRTTEGRVAVAAVGEQAVLGAGDVAELSDGRMVLSRAINADALAWRENRLVFSNQPLGRVMRTLERYRRGRIVVLDRRAEELRISGIFSVQDTEQVLAAISASLPVSVTRVTDLLVLIRMRG